MNKRINELRLNAGISLLHNEPLLVVVNKDGTINKCPLEGLEKFAELIVAKCALLCLEDKDSQRILEHFGIEE